MVKILLFSFLLLSLPFIIRPSFAQCIVTEPSASPRAEGLISAPTINGVDNTSGNCVLGSPAPVSVSTAKILRSYTYDGLKKTFYTNSKFSYPTKANPNKHLLNNGHFFVTFDGKKAKFISDGLFLNSNVSPNDPNMTIDPNNFIDNTSGVGTQVFFVDGDLNINKDIIYHPNDSGGGLVFVVQGDINVKSSVVNVDAVLISFESICSAYDTGSSSCIDIDNKALTVNGSLISLACSDPSDPSPTCTTPSSHINLVRSITPNTSPAEIINAQPKYLQLLTVNDLMDEDLIIPNESQ